MEDPEGSEGALLRSGAGDCDRMKGIMKSEYYQDNIEQTLLTSSKITIEG